MIKFPSKRSGLEMIDFAAYGCGATIPAIGQSSSLSNFGEIYYEKNILGTLFPGRLNFRLVANLDLTDGGGPNRFGGQPI